MSGEHPETSPVPTGEVQDLYGLLVEFDDPDNLVAAAEKVRDAGYTRWDAHTPFPLHGLDSAMGIRQTILPWIVLCAGLIGLTAGLILQWWTNAIDYPFIISGKPLFSLPANIPVIFEVTVLFSAVAAFLSMLALNQLPELYHPTLKSERFRRVTMDRFFITVEANDPRFDRKETWDFLASLDGNAVEALEA